MDLHQKLFLYFSALALLAQCHNVKPKMGDPIKDPQRMMEAMHKKMDIDGDGRLSLNEVIEFSRLTFKVMAANASADRMEVYDTNKDGQLSFEEMIRDYEDIDTNRLSDHEKKILEEQTRTEKQHLKDRFEAADTNKDGKLDKNELGQIDWPQASPDVLKALAQTSVKRKDQDGDGKLDPKEFFSGLEKNGRWKKFAQLDVDGDGKLSEEELYVKESSEHSILTAFKALFADADTDKDSHLSLDEFHKHMPLMGQHAAADYITEWMFHHRIDEL